MKNDVMEFIISLEMAGFWLQILKNEMLIDQEPCCDKIEINMFENGESKPLEAKNETVNQCLQELVSEYILGQIEINLNDDSRTLQKNENEFIPGQIEININELGSLDRDFDTELFKNEIEILWNDIGLNELWID